MTALGFLAMGTVTALALRGAGAARKGGSRGRISRGDAADCVSEPLIRLLAGVISAGTVLTRNNVHAAGTGFDSAAQVGRGAPDLLGVVPTHAAASIAGIGVHGFFGGPGIGYGCTTGDKAARGVQVFADVIEAGDVHALGAAAVRKHAIRDEARS